MWVMSAVEDLAGVLGNFRQYCNSAAKLPYLSFLKSVQTTLPQSSCCLSKDYL